MLLLHPEPVRDTTTSPSSSYSAPDRQTHEAPAALATKSFVRERFRDRHQAVIHPAYVQWHSTRDGTGGLVAALGYRDAGTSKLFLEQYLSRPVEKVVSERLNMSVLRGGIVEIGCLAAASSWALLQLWCSTAELLHQDYTVAVATLTAPVRHSLERLGIPLVQIGVADPARVNSGSDDWGSYYELHPTVCAGIVADGVRALATAPPIKRTM